MLLNIQEASQPLEKQAKVVKQIHPELVRFKDARKTFFQLAEQLGDTPQAKQLCRQTADSLASNGSNYKNEGMVKKVDDLHMMALQKFKFAEIIRKLFDKFTEIVKTGKDAPLWLLKTIVFKDEKYQGAYSFSDRKPDYDYIDKSIQFFNDSLNEGYWAKENTEAKDFDMILKKIALIDKEY